MSRWHGSGRESLGEFTWSGNPSRGMKAKKRLEAEERNAATPEVRRKAFRCTFADENGLVPTAVPANTRKKRGRNNAA